MAQVKLDLSGLDEWQEKLEKAAGPAGVEAGCRTAVGRMAAVYLDEAKKNTPVSGKIIRIIDKRHNRVYTSNTEHMRRSWGAGRIVKLRRAFSVRVFNSASYASYVNDGHRQHAGRFVPVLGKRLKKSYVEGLYMAEKAEHKLKRDTPAILQGVLDDICEEAMNLK
ncbi:MAG: HK97 gp10 family phage protein [Acidaminococcaceae bacterium]|nr:HK97 gp10 family phage protein [Acidaminococcaceae bacterium]